MQRRKKKASKALNSTNPLIIIGLITLVAAIVLLLAILLSSYYEQRGFSALKSDMIGLQSEFNTIDAGWEYDEYCTGYGSDVARSDSITCFIQLKNSSIVGNIDSKYESYMRLINNSGNYENLLATEYTPSNAKPDLQIQITKIKYKKNSKCVCEARTQAYSENSNRGIMLSCWIEASKFYFERRD